MNDLGQEFFLCFFSSHVLIILDSAVFACSKNGMDGRILKRDGKMDGWMDGLKGDRRK